MINEQLFDLYHQYTEQLCKLYSDLDNKEISDYAGPLLPCCWEEKYLKSKFKLVIFGQETNGWCSQYVKSDDDIRKYIEVYRQFKLGKNNSTLFWRYAHRFNFWLNGEDDLNFVWNNINKFGKNSGKGKPDQAVLADELCFYNIIREEIKILNPDVCLFLTGPDYDDYIKRKFTAVQFCRLSSFGSRQVAKLESVDLPINTYRTYHPGYGNRIFDLYNKILKAIVEDCTVNPLWRRQV